MEAILTRAFRPRFPHSLIVKAPGLLPMLYTLPELEEDTGVSVGTLRDWLTNGLPHKRDNSGHIWIAGHEFATWVAECRAEMLGTPLQADQAYCLRCRKAVPLSGSTRRVNGKQVLYSGTCPDCGAKINRGGRNGE
jgi:Domain of unknown function (DUF5679)